MTLDGPYKKRFILLAILITILLALQCILPALPGAGTAFSEHIFQPFQYLRNKIFGNVAVSFGDIFYVAAGMALLVLMIRWIFFILHFNRYKHSLGRSILRTLIGACIIYLLFFLGWGGNYNKPPLSDSWKLNDTASLSDSALFTFDSCLISRLNNYAPHYHAISFKETDIRAAAYYRLNTDISMKLIGLNVKPSFFGQTMQYMGIQGYYNPFTGEAQVNSQLPDFMLPFVVCHELAHQVGIAAEDDANLMAYALGTTAKDTAFNYSCYFNLWLYTHSRLKMEDSARARRLYKTLNTTSVAHLDTLRAINKRYRSKIGRYSNGLYDGYLRFHHVKHGIESYDDVVQSAYAWEQLAAKRKDSLIHIP